MNREERYMQEALEIARTAEGHTSPNPMVGCVVVKDDRIISKACHEKYGEFHAERNALLRCEEDASGAELFVTLEPCCHQGKTPPCTDIIIENNVSKVYVGSMDPNPKVAGNGVKILREHGIEVQTGVLEGECLELNEIFFHYITSNRPFVAMKYAMTLDGKIATYTGDSKWITGEIARNHVHQLRNKYSAILVGIDTVLADDPMLNCRLDGGVNPVRVILDSKLRVPLECNLVRTAKDISTIVVYTKENPGAVDKLKEKGITCIRIEGEDQVNLDCLLDILGERNIDSVLVEGGGSIHGSFLKERLVDRVYAYIAPKLIGGCDAKSPVEGCGIQLMRDALELNKTEIITLGNDICVTGRL
ncbi:bifunctional diaminohydroxyphosphoribosylaminopyrimidine deaminase/5-amino-6-(5-phosphoribosylamino)uracil reductase RibD [Eubacterium xylanophilum]|uniref:bifunctional diaminohydroxyphosphoribosylaminopyrimidine deaminase/5-amino-6-(5-phosphoribosylamino)uracil reductase RibD n=1 Tax=Eubacterium xylanophilum TaxID=39497 RepID=UPI0004B75457|nr:bifunctional diaminohydroxyphosphoribosylaminopyrimidine deaminase/5-amino-6-(5-phosphoribosylamino)uracil reductase RibD [Eubacterium xylanophilum]